MRFYLGATSIGLQDNILEEYPILSKYNIEHIKYDKKIYEFEYYKTYITINSLKELIQLSEDVNNELIIRDGAIEIYDSYRE